MVCRTRSEIETDRTGRRRRVQMARSSRLGNDWQCFASMSRRWRAQCALCRRTHAWTCINSLRAIHRFDRANSVTICAVFFAKPR
jgi:hypothetical protein